MYKKFMQHAKKITNTERTDGRPILKGVKHYEDGSLVVTDSHRLYIAEDIHDKGEAVITPDDKEIDGNYPEVARLIPQEARQTITLNVNEMLRGVEIIYTANAVCNSERHNKESAFMRWEENLLSMNEDEEIAAEYKLPETYQLTVVKNLYSNPRYWVEALKLFKAFKYKEVDFNLTNGVRPFTLTSKDEKLLALIMPVRTY